MGLSKLLTNEKIILTQMEARNSYDAIEKLGRALYLEGYVKDTFLDAVIEREKNYPTGIQGSEFNIAIPHVDNSHVKRPGIGVGVLKEKVIFKRMDEPNLKLDVKVVFLLAIETPEYHLRALRELMNLLQDSSTMKKICQSSSPKELIKIINRRGENKQ